MNAHLDPERMNREQLLALVYDMESKLADLLPRDADKLARGRTSLGLTPAEAVIAHVLSDGAEHSADALATLAGSSALTVRSNLMPVHISRLRKKLAPLGVRIVNVHGYGYWMAEGADKVRAAMEAR